MTVSATKPSAIGRKVPLGKSGAFAEGHMRSHSITIENGLATARAHVSLADQRPGMLYVWRLQVVDSKENPLAGMVYDQQMFTVEANGQKEVDFQDVVAVPPPARGGSNCPSSRRPRPKTSRSWMTMRRPTVIC